MWAVWPIKKHLCRHVTNFVQSDSLHLLLIVYPSLGRHVLGYPVVCRRHICEMVVLSWVSTGPRTWLPVWWLPWACMGQVPPKAPHWNTTLSLHWFCIGVLYVQSNVSMCLWQCNFQLKCEKLQLPTSLCGVEVVVVGRCKCHLLHCRPCEADNQLALYRVDRHCGCFMPRCGRFTSH